MAKSVLNTRECRCFAASERLSGRLGGLEIVGAHLFNYDSSQIAQAIRVPVRTIEASRLIASDDTINSLMAALVFRLMVPGTIYTDSLLYMVASPTFFGASGSLSQESAHQVT